MLQTASVAGVDFELEDPEIDPRSFHVFEIAGDRLLFDRATGTTSSLNPVAYHLLMQIRNGTPVPLAVQSTATEFAGVDSDELRLALLDMKDRGFFRFTAVQPATEEELQYLWEHKPRRIQMLMAEGCNLGCRYCYQWRNGTNQKGTLMPWNVARTAVDYLMWRSGGRKDLQVTFFGGEPLLNYPMIKRVVAYCKSIEATSDRKFIFELITNGTLLTPDVVDFLVEHRFLLFISLDGWKEMHNYNRPALDGKSDLHDVIVRHATHANALYEKHGLPRIKVRANLTNRFHDKQQVADYFHSLGFKTIGIGAITPLPHGDPSHAALTEDQMDELHQKSWQSTQTALEKLKQGERLTPFETKSLREGSDQLQKRETLGVTCGVCRNTTVVDNKGNMYPCHRYGEMQEYRIGNIFTGLDRRLVMAYYQKINGHSSIDCHDCWIRDYCGGGCAWEISDSKGAIHKPTLRECHRRRTGMEQHLWLRKELLQKAPQFVNQEETRQFECFDWDMLKRPAPGAAVAPIPSAATSLPVISTGATKSCGSGCGCGSNPASPQSAPAIESLAHVQANATHSNRGGQNGAGQGGAAGLMMSLPIVSNSECGSCGDPENGCTSCSSNEGTVTLDLNSLL